MPRISLTDIFNTIKENPDAKVTIDTLTVVPLKGGKGNSFQNRVHKFVEEMEVELYIPGVKNGYAERVKERAAAEGLDPDNYVAKPRAWGTRIDNTPVIEHKGEHYIEVFVTKPGTSSLLYDFEGKGDTSKFRPISPESVEGYPEKKDEGSHTQDGLTEKVVVRTIKKANILRFRVGDKVFDPHAE